MSLRTWIDSHPRNERKSAVGAVAAACSVGKSSVTHWASGIRKLRPEHCPAIEGLTGVKCEELCPEVTWLRDSAGNVSGYQVHIATG